MKVALFTTLVTVTVSCRVRSVFKVACFDHIVANAVAALTQSMRLSLRFQVCPVPCTVRTAAAMFAS